MEDKGEVLYELSPKFDFFYELTMPTGKKIKSSFITVIVTLILNIVCFAAKGYVSSLDNITISNVYGVSTIVCVILFIFSILLFISKIVMQVLEYKGIKYKFYKNCLVFENNFLSQTKKTIEYSNIREVEIRRTITDRLMNYGVIIIYTNADKAFGSATVLYAIKNTEEHYNNIESLIHNGNVISSPIKTGNSTNDLKQEIDLKNAMEKKETYTDYNATSDNNPLNKE
jgi:membrane protein YdbS with pleckstrin-like domain